MQLKDLIQQPETQRVSGGLKMNKCKYCDKGVPLIIGKTNDYGMAIQYPRKLIAYGYDIHGYDSNGLVVKINYCPICGKKLSE